MYTIVTPVEARRGAACDVREGVFGAGDARAHEWIVSLRLDGAPLPLDGYEILCHVLRGDGTEGAQIAGEARGNTARVTLGADCYAVPGDTRLTMRALEPGGGAVWTLATLRYRVE